MALVKGSLPDAQARAKDLGEAARGNERDAIAARADAVAKATELESARHAFAELSDAMIAYRSKSTEEPKPVVVYCSMAKHSWLQPKGDISNPYLDASMQTCGEVKEQ
jgi:Cu(I)/Ag(I) efflux system membrane fusion protein